MNKLDSSTENFRTYLTVDIERLVFGTIEKVQAGADWNIAWQNTYHEIGGKSRTSAEKQCPMKGAETLYLLGRIRGAGRERVDASLETVLKNYSKNGVYALLALILLPSNSDISQTKLWEKIKACVKEDLKEIPACSNQGGATVAFKLWHLGLAT